MLTVPTYATNCLTGVVMFPVLLVVMAVGIGRETDGMALSEVVAQFVPKKRLSGGCRGLPGADLYHGTGRVHRRVA